MTLLLKRSLHTVAALAAVAILAGTPAVQAQLRGNFDDADTNHDGHVTLQEFTAYATRQLAESSGRKAKRFQQLSPQEQQSRLQARFEQLDRGHKGYLDRSDWESAPRRSRG